MIISMPNEAFTAGPDVTWRHVDGPLMHRAGHLHWLTWKERASLFFDIKTVDEIACARWPHLAKIREELWWEK